VASWHHLDISIPMILNLGLSGQPFSGPDIGGFIGHGDGPMFERWMGFGALLPFARGHTGNRSIMKEPWAFNPGVEETCRYALQRRYRLMPYIYTLFREASLTGLPVARPLFFADPADPALRSIDDSFLLGGDLLVAVRTSPDGEAETVRPKGPWYRLDLGLGAGDDPDLPDIFLRGGAIIPIGPVMNYVDEKPNDPLRLLVGLDDSGKAEGFLYEDDGEGYAYREGGFRLVRFSAAEEEGVVTVAMRVAEGDWELPERRVVVQLWLPGGDSVEAEGNGVDPIRVSIH